MSKIGVVGENHEIYFEVEPESEIKDDEVPIQVQVTYTDEKGARRVRAVTTKLSVAKKEEELNATLDPTLGATFVTQKAGVEAFAEGEKGRKKGLKRVQAFRSAMRSRAKGAPKEARKRFERADMVLEVEENEMDNVDKMMEDVGGAPCAAADKASTKSLAQMKRSSRDLFDDEE